MFLFLLIQVTCATTYNRIVVTSYSSDQGGFMLDPNHTSAVSSNLYTEQQATKLTETALQLFKDEFDIDFTNNY